MCIRSGHLQKYSDVHLYGINWVRSTFAKTKVYDKSLRPKFGLRPGLRPNLTSSRRLDQTSVLDQALDQKFGLRPKLSWTQWVRSTSTTYITTNNNYMTEMQEIGVHLFAHSKNKKLKFRWYGPEMLSEIYILWCPALSIKSWNSDDMPTGPLIP